jgi:hypothetical protein
LHRTIVGFERLPGDRQVIAIDCGTQVVLLQIGLFHQPIGKPAQQLGLRAAALMAARPQPDLIRQQQCDAALADAIEQQKRLAAVGAEQRLAVHIGRLDAAVP